jgi:hypothetical protein
MSTEIVAYEFDKTSIAQQFGWEKLPPKQQDLLVDNKYLELRKDYISRVPTPMESIEILYDGNEYHKEWFIKDMINK